MASLAGLLKQRGLKVTGSDAAAYPPMSDFLAQQNIPLAQPYAVEAARLAPRNFVARRELGRVKLHAGDIPGAITELETARRLEPSSPSVRFNLARAYLRAGREVDAKRERGEFTRLQEIQQKQRGAASGAAGEESEEQPPQ